MTSLEERYKLAASLVFGERDKLLCHGAVRPRWSVDGRHFWYATQAADGLVHVLVDVAQRSRMNLPDRAALSLAWQQATGAALDVAAEDSAFAAHEAVSPDGSAAALLQGPNLHLRERGHSGTRALTTDGEPDCGYGDFSDFISQVAVRSSDQPRKACVIWSPDSQRLAVLRSDLRKLPLQHLVQGVPPTGVRPLLHSVRYDMPGDAERAHHSLWFIKRDGTRVQARIERLQGHVITPFSAGQQGRWSADGRHFLLVDGNRDATCIALWRICADTGAADLLVEETGPGVMRASPSLAEPPVFHLLSDGRLIWWSQRSGWGHLTMIAPGGGARAITQGDWQVRSLLHVDEARQRMLFMVSGREAGLDPYLCHAYSVHFDGSGLTLLTPEPAQHECDASPDGSTFVDSFSTVTMPPQALLRDRNGAVLMALENADPGSAWPATMPLPEPFSITALDGSNSLWGLLYKPLGFDPAQHYPIVEVIYGAPQTAVVPKTWGSNMHGSVAEQLAALGFVVVMLDGPGTVYRSHAFNLAAHGKLETCGGLPDHVNAIRQLGATRPWMDLSRVGMVGGSGGGYATVRAMATFPDFFKVGVAMCGNHDQAAYTAMWGETYQGLFSEALYATQANTTVAAHITGDLLLIHGDMDDNVHPAMTLRVVDALIQADRDFSLLIVPNAGHMLVNLPYVRRRMYDYFVRRLMGAEPPRPRRPS